MQPPSVLFGHCFRAETAASFKSFPAVRNFGPNSFNFKELSKTKGSPDYFSVKHVGGSSPTASLAADLSQNFHIDQSPQLVTPRRSLFSANSFGSENGRVLFKIHQLGQLIPIFRQMSNSQPFVKFGNGNSKLSTSTSLSLSEIFEGSPERPASRTNLSNEQMGLSRPRAPFSSFVGQSRGNGSPGHGAVRKGSNPFSRPRKQCRRSLSMFEHPDDVMNQDNDASVNILSLSDMEEAPTLHLPHFIPEDQPDSLPRIESTVLVDILDGKYNDKYNDIIIIDCRFEYEYEGGHINGAVNYNDKEHLASRLFSEDMKPNTMLVFHCEYSAHRAPIMAKFIRHKDRAVNIDEYPKLTYPEMYILDGGYSAFFSVYRSLCIPQNYVEMAAKEHAFACERGLGKVKQRSKLARAQTFAFGQHSTTQMEDSPTGRCRNAGSDRNLSLEIPEPGRLPGRRMFSH
ncbi:M-phase inducer phosphatase [Histoplasma mississippiense (nom. inval.)]|uniref:M-phase inducer phosphatase n=1 Tax=Ajellomyces capsulatus (strain NAm1 / WU24) TaxID=2059318 RepID=UPI000157CC94|nr:M-phase inducer phosphatase [Histoplasma mississippiense (nom. inval.)]EDN10095.1 M-phase inducer phosphatase [Histoplasma mississippiense (nom. inval.)]